LSESAVDDVIVARDVAVMVDASVVSVPLAVLSVNPLPFPDEIVPALANPRAVADTEMVSRDETPVSAPAVLTLSPVEVTWKVPVAFPSVVLLPAPLESVVVPVEVRPVKAPVPGVVAPIETKFAVPSPAIFQFASLSARSVLLVLPIVMVPVLVPVPMLVLLDPLVLMFVVPVSVAPAVAVRRPFIDTASSP
jgi:hypothetical protein